MHHGASTEIAMWFLAHAPFIARRFSDQNRLKNAIHDLPRECKRCCASSNEA
jgi:hypothetical protein